MSKFIRTAFLVIGFSLEATAGASATNAVSPKAAESFLELQDARLHYEECGSGPDTVVLIHDGVVDSRVWDSVWPIFCGKFHTIRYDRRGYGRSPAATTWYSETEDLLALLQHLNINRTVLVGSSHGGQLSIDFTLEYPERVKQLVLVGAVVTGLPYTQHFLSRGESTFVRVDKRDVKDGIAAWANDRYLTGAGSKAARHKLLELLLSKPQDVTHADLRLPRKPALPRLGEIGVPTLLLVGEEDIPDVHAHAGALQAGVRNATRVIVKGVGHLMYLEKPEEFSRLAIDFISKNSRLDACCRH